MEYVKTFDASVASTLNQYVKKPTIIRGVVHLLLILYAARVAPELPRPVLNLFENQYFKLFVFSLILWTAQFSPSTSILIALAFMVTVNYSMQKPLWELLENTENTVPQTPVEAVQQLAEAAASPVAAPPAEVAKAVEVAQSAVQTSEGAQAVQALAEAAVVPEAAPAEKVIQVATVAVSSMTPEPVVVPAPAAPTPAPAPAPAPAAAPAQETPKVAVSEPASCYPIRRYDMEKVQPVELSDSHGEWAK